MDDTKNELMSTYGMNQKDFGSAMVTEAKNRQQKAKIDRSVSAVQNMIEALDTTLRQIEHLRGWQKTYEARIKALEKGEFYFGQGEQIIFNDSALNRV